MHVMLFMLHVCVCCESVRVQGCEGARVAAMLKWGPGRCSCGECVYEWYMWFRCFV